MGQQQLHLIVLGVIVVGISVAIGLEIYRNQAVQSNRDAVISDLNNLAIFAQAFYKKHESLDGGGSNYTGFEIPEDLKVNDNGTYSIIKTQSQAVTIEGIGTETESTAGCSQSNNITYRIIVEPHQITLQTIH